MNADESVLNLQLAVSDVLGLPVVSFNMTMGSGLLQDNEERGVGTNYVIRIGLGCGAVCSLQAVRLDSGPSPTRSVGRTSVGRRGRIAADVEFRNAWRQATAHTGPRKTPALAAWMASKGSKLTPSRPRMWQTASLHRGQKGHSCSSKGCRCGRGRDKFPSLSPSLQSSGVGIT